MLNANDHKNFTACGDKEAEVLLEKVLSGMKEALSGTGLCVVLGGSYGRGDGGVRQDKENGILYNDLDFFVFARKKSAGSEKLLKNIAGKYEAELKIDVDFSRIMTVKEMKNNAHRLMMQELKRGYFLVCGENLLAEYLPEIPAEKLPFSEACRLLFNRGMGLLLAGEKISSKEPETDFILRNIYKALLGCGDAMLIAEGKYRWQLKKRCQAINNSALPEKWKKLYCQAVDFKRSPSRNSSGNVLELWQDAASFTQAMILNCSGTADAAELSNAIFSRSRQDGEVSLKNYLKYAIKTRSFFPVPWKKYAVPAVAGILPELYDNLGKLPDKTAGKSKLFQHWLIFN